MSQASPSRCIFTSEEMYSKVLCTDMMFYVVLMARAVFENIAKHLNSECSYRLLVYWIEIRIRVCA